MSDTPGGPGSPGQGPDDENSSDNPFKGTPFEQMFSAFGGAGGGQLPDLGALMGRCST